MTARLSEIEARVLAAIDTEAMVETLCELIALRSEGDQETPAQRYVARWMREQGMVVDEWEIDFEKLRRHEAYTVEIERDQGLGVVGEIGTGAGPKLLLNGHIDVVPAGEASRWTVPPWTGTVRDGRVYGRGSADMKGGLVAALYAAKAIIDADIELQGMLQVQSVIGEEDGGAGTLATIARGHVGDAAIIMEPTELMVAPAQAGAYNFRITVPGKAAHGALRTEGVDPIARFMPIYAALERFEQRRNDTVTNPLFIDYEVPFALCVGTLRCGIWASTVAENLVCEGRLGISPDESAALVRAQFERCVMEAARAQGWPADHPPQVQWWGAQFEPAAIAPDHRLVSTVSGAFQHVTEKPATVRGMPYGADMRLLVHQGATPTVIFGPGDVRHAHAPDEFVPIAELEIAARTLAVAALRFCGVAVRKTVAQDR